MQMVINLAPVSFTNKKVNFYTCSRLTFLKKKMPLRKMLKRALCMPPDPSSGSRLRRSNDLPRLVLKSGYGPEVNVVRTKLSLFLQSWRCSYKVWTLFVQSRRCPCKVGVVRTKCEHYSYKVVVVLAKLTLFVQSCRRSLHKVLYKERRKLAS